MGEVKISVTIRNPLNGKKSLQVDALVDTGAVMVMLPKDAIERLGVRVKSKALVTLADETTIEMPVAGPISIAVQDREMSIDCLVGPYKGEPLLGQIALEGLDLIVDSGRQTLVPRPESPAYPSYKLK